MQRYSAIPVRSHAASEGAGLDGNQAVQGFVPSRRPARDLVYDYVRQGILHGRLAAGTFLEEEQVSAAVGVPRTPVREAFQQLQGERLLELLPRRGAMIRLVTVRELLEILETRLMIETHAARALCRGRLPLPDGMRAALAQMQLQPDADIPSHVQLNTAFHEALVEAGGNGVITGLYRSITFQQERVAMAAVSIGPGRRRVILLEHEQLAAALAAHDEAAAIAVLGRHLHPAQDVLARLPECQ